MCSMGVLVLLTFVVLIPSVQPSRDRKFGVRLDYVCAVPRPSSKAAGKIPVIMLHGLTDIKETWNGIYENVSSLTNRKVCIYDARNHGGSSWNDTLTIDATVEDLGNFMKMMKMNRAFLVGHSMGGHTVMKFALTNPSRVAGIFVEDIALKIPEGNGELEAYLKILKDSLSAIPDGADWPTAKKAVLDYIREATGGEPLPTYVTNLPVHRVRGVWKWKINFKSIEKAIEIGDSPFSDVEGLQYDGKALFLYGTASPFKVGEQEEDLRKLYPNVELVAVEGADHIIHSFYDEFMEQLIKFLE